MEPGRYRDALAYAPHRARGYEERRRRLKNPEANPRGRRERPVRRHEQPRNEKDAVVVIVVGASDSSRPGSGPLVTPFRPSAKGRSKERHQRERKKKNRPSAFDEGWDRRKTYARRPDFHQPAAAHREDAAGKIRNVARGASRNARGARSHTLGTPFALLLHSWPVATFPGRGHGSLGDARR
ncbi:hypothetical protein KM043_010503 [Ampulex compressa]|nr:hypothetical protein KM043_010503 [Ampulex compressa]